MSKTIIKGILLTCLCVWLFGIGFACAYMAAGESFAEAIRVGFCVSLAISAFLSAGISIGFGLYFFQKNI